MPVNTVAALTDIDFRAQVLGAKGDVLVEFWKTGCHFCDELAPTVERLAASLPQLPVRSYRIEYRDPSQRLWKRHAIQVTPTLVLFRDGAEVWRATGVVPLAQLRRQLTGALRRPPELGVAS